MEFLFQENTFTSYSPQHYWPLFVVFIIGILIIGSGMRLENHKSKKNLIFAISFIPLLAYMMTLMFPLFAGEFELKEHLPLHICRFIAVVMPFAIWFDNERWLKVFYFWILAGTLNANITPDAEFGFPHWSYFGYWMLHSFLIIIPIYYVMVFKQKIKWEDLKRAFMYANLFLLFTLILNYLLGSNYMYSYSKPPGGSILDFFGPWPLYLITGQLLVLVLFAILYLPFGLRRR